MFQSALPQCQVHGLLTVKHWAITRQASILCGCFIMKLPHWQGHVHACMYVCWLSTC
jgi:hypothetical protein